MVRIRTTCKSDIRIEAKRLFEEAEAEPIEILSLLGDKCLGIAREQSWQNKTHNLASSIGYIVTHKGDVVRKGGFEGTEDGVAAGFAYAVEVAGGTSAKYALIIVAGMHYASFVEANGYPVLAKAELWLRSSAEKVINGLMNEK